MTQDSFSERLAYGVIQRRTPVLVGLDPRIDMLPDSLQPTHATSDMPWAEARLGTDRLAGAYAWRRFLDADVALCFGSDFPVELVDVTHGLYAAVTR